MSVEVRVAKKSDIPAVAGMAKSFFEESKWAEFGLGQDVDSTLLWFASLLDKQSVELFVAENSNGLVGFAVGGVRPWILKMDDLLGFELAFYVKPDHRRGTTGKKLLSAIEEWCHTHGAKAIEAGASEWISGGRVGKLFERCGYKSAIRGYMKTLGRA